MDAPLLRAFRERLPSAGIFLDFDGTLSEIVDVPADARPVAGAADLLARLSETAAVVAVVSGRSAHQLIEWLGPEVEIWGLHGAERAVDGAVVLSPEVQPFAGVIQEVVRVAKDRVAEEGLSGVVVEDKRVMLGLHWRAALDADRASVFLDSLADDLAARFGLTRAEGRLVYELRPPVELTKADVVRKRAVEAELDSVAFVGDDRVDLPAFAVLDELAAEGRMTVRVAVDSPEAPPELVDRADVVVAGPRGVLGLLSELLGGHTG